MVRTALVVDDSRTALVSLGRLLKARGLQVETAESGPEALDYLRLNPPPAAVFLDHMMPGMDGFETLAEIKRDPRTASIPVVMYTSVEGQGYIESARAHGATAVLHKPPQPEELQRILAGLSLPRAVGTEESSVERLLARGADAGTDSTMPALSARPVPPVVPQPSPVALADEFQVRSSGSTLWIVLVVALAGAMAWAFQLYRQADAEREEAVQDSQRLQAALTEQRELTRQARIDLEAARAAVDTSTRKTTLDAAPGPAEPSRAVLNAITWALNQQSSYDFGGTPFNDERLRILRELLPRLTEIGFRGTIRFDSHVGEFCVVRGENGAYQLPPPTTPFSRCEVLRYTPGHAVVLGQRQSEEFTKFLMQRALTDAPIDIVISSYGIARPAYRFPDNAVPTTAGEWNAVARANQRVEVVLVPRAR
jgi:CheY-like chemotaxis protein